MPEPIAPHPSEQSELEQLRRENERLRQEKAAIEKDRERLEVEKENEDLREKLEAVKREMYRQAGPFRIDPKKRAQTKKKPGRKPGHPGACRARPEAVDEEIVVPLKGCPHCGKVVTSCHPVEQFTEGPPQGEAARHPNHHLCRPLR